jgi:phage terminase large subunit-like protein
VQVFKGIDANIPVKKVYASRGKFLRAEPISALYAEGRVAHVGEFPELERQMCDFAADGLANGKSPDRLDALVWALTELMLTVQRNPRIHGM